MPGIINVAPAVTPVPSATKLSVASEDAQKARRALLKGSRVLIIQAGYLSKRFIYDALYDLGVNLSIVDAGNHWSKAMVEEGRVKNFIEVDPLPFDNIYERTIAAIRASGLTFDGVTTFWEEAVPLASRIAAELSLPTNPLSACDLARNKGKTRELMKAAGLPAAKFFRIFGREQLDGAIAEVGFPAIIKPVFGAASRGVVRCDTAAEVFAVFDELVATLTADVDPIWAQGAEFVLEEYYDGDEFDIDVLMNDGEVVYCKVADNWACQPPYYLEPGENVPSLAPSNIQKELEDLATGSLKAMGFQRGCFHVEAKYTSRGPRLIEVNARMGGMSVREVHRQAWGVDFVEEHVMSMVGIPIRPVVPARPLRHVAMVFLTAPHSGRMAEGDEWLRALRAHPRVLSAKSLHQPGAAVRGPQEGLPDWIGEVIVTLDAEDADTKDVLRVAREVTFSVSPPVVASNASAASPWYWPAGFPFSLVDELSQ